MILVISEKTDVSTRKVLYWLETFKVPFILWFPDEGFKVKEINLDNFNNPSFVIQNKQTTIRSDDISKVWYRRGNINGLATFSKFISNNESINSDLRRFYFQEIQAIDSFIHLILGNKPNLGDYRENEIGKFEILIAAKNVGFQIPKTICTDNKNALKNAFRNEVKVVWKAAYQSPSFNIKDDNFHGYTSRIEANDLPNLFFTSKFQKEIAKYCEIRVFAIEEKLYSMAIFTQSNPHTAIDSRNRIGLPNREIPWKLPEDESNRLIKIMKTLKLKTCSFDLILTKDFTYIFLELNVIGQFDNVSINCNYQLEKRISSFLKN
jgi:ATP-GRASP peptide maturase of grasp-with-spasm system